MKNRITSIFLIVLLLFSYSINCFAVNEQSFSPWSENNIYKGEEETNTLASKLDRANLAYILVEAFDFEPSENVRMSDVSKDHWAYTYICTAINNGIMKLDNGKFFPDQYITREEIPQYFKFLDISYPQSLDMKFKDMDKVSPEYKDMFSAFVAAGYIQALSGEYLLPQRIITITETINILNKMFPNISNKVLKNAVYDGHFIMKDNYTYLSNIEITGDMVITEGTIMKNANFANNFITLDNITVKGNIYIMNGSLAGKFIFKNVQANNIVIVGSNPIVINFSECNFQKFQTNASLNNIVSNKLVDIERI